MSFYPTLSVLEGWLRMNCNKNKNKCNALTTLVIDDDKSTTSIFFRHMRLLGGSGFDPFSYYLRGKDV